MILRLFHEVEVTAFDVWDNRQWKAFQCYCGQLDERLDVAFNLGMAQREYAHKLLAMLRRAASFDEVYRQLNIHYVVDPVDTLRLFDDASFDVVISYNVLEHVDRAMLPKLIHDFYHVLKPGGYSIHRINLKDHLAYYDRYASVKQYLRYSDIMWKRFFENEVQYFNRVQRPDWLALFQQMGFITIEEMPITGDLGTISIANPYQHLQMQDLQCTAIHIVHQK